MATITEQYRERDCYRAAATVYRALFEGIDDNYNRIDAAYHHYVKALQSALDGYVDYVLGAAPDDIGVLGGGTHELTSHGHHLRQRLPLTK